MWSGRVILTSDTPEVTSEESLLHVVAITLIVHATLISEGMSAPSITRSVRQLRGTLVLRQSRIPVHYIVRAIECCSRNRRITKYNFLET